jgi:hypothetical protein
MAQPPDARSAPPRAAAPPGAPDLPSIPGVPDVRAGNMEALELPDVDFDADPSPGDGAAGALADLADIELPALAEQPARRRSGGVLPASLGVFFTVFVHAVVVYAAYHATHAESDIDYHPPTVIDARLLKLGATVTPDMLPHKAVSPPPAKKVVSLSGDKTGPKLTPTDRRDAPDPKDAEHTAKDSKLLDSLDEFDKDAKPTTDTKDEGSEEGVKGGTLKDPALARAADKWMTALVKLFRKEWGVTAMSKDMLDRLSCKVHVDISRSGEVSGHKMTKPSGNDLFDSAAMAAAGAVKEIPSEMLDRMPKEFEPLFIDGLSIEYKGSDL